MKDLLASSTNFSPIRDRAGRSISAMKSLVLRGKDERTTSELGVDDKFTVLMQLLFDSGILNHSDREILSWRVLLAVFVGILSFTSILTSMRILQRQAFSAGILLMALSGVLQQLFQEISMLLLLKVLLLNYQK